MYQNRSQYLFAIVCSLAIVAVVPSAFAAGPVPAVPAAPLSSSFPGPLWEVVAPVGGTAAVSNQHLFLNVPGGSNHDTLHPSNQAVRVVQPIGDQSFDVSIKIDSPVVATDTGTSQGLMVLADDENFITFALVTNGTNLGLSVQTITNGVAATVFDQASFNEYQNPMYLRLTRTGVSYHSLLLGRWSGLDADRRLYRHQGSDLDRALCGQLQPHSVQGYSCRHGHQLVQHPMTCIRKLASRCCVEKFSYE